MKAATGALLTVLTIGLIFIGLGLVPSTATKAQAPASAQPAPAATVAAASYTEQPVQAAATPADAESPMLVDCGPGRQTLVRQAWLNGQQVSQVVCVGGGTASVAVAPAAVRTIGYGYEPVVYDAPVVARPLVRSTSVAPRRYAAPSYRTAPRRSWQKTALVIGGGTAAGAGIGGLIGGGKGALIGAAIGGGATGLFEATRRR